MRTRFLLFGILVLANAVAVLALRRGTAQWIRPERRNRVGRWVLLGVLLLNIPLLAFLIPPADVILREVPPTLLRIFFYPAAAWMVTVAAFFLIACIAGVPWVFAKEVARLISKGGGPGSAKALQKPPEPGEVPGVTRRNVLAGAASVLIPGIYGVAAYGVYSHMDEIDVSKECSVAIPHLPPSLDGLTIVQFSDIHVGPYIRSKQLQHVVSITNQLHPDVVVITGDILDRHLSSLPDAVTGLRGIRASHGIFAVLGNHDYYADRYSRSGHYRGGVKIVRGLESVGIRTLRNEVVHIGTGHDRLALLGLDWLTTSPTDRSFYSYKPVETRRQLRRMLNTVAPDTPRVLLAHHPDTFLDVPSDIALTLSGHTHGGGQVVLGYMNGVPIGIATLRFKYLSGLYRKNGCSLYVNRGIGYLGVPIRINCPPEISRFKLIRPGTTT